VNSPPLFLKSINKQCIFFHEQQVKFDEHIPAYIYSFIALQQPEKLIHKFILLLLNCRENMDRSQYSDTIKGGET
jgi:hypothetical protein